MDGANEVKDSHLALRMSLISCQCCWTHSYFCCRVCSLAEALGDDGGQLFFLQVSYCASENCRRGKKDILPWLIKPLESIWVPATGSHEWQDPNEVFQKGSCSSLLLSCLNVLLTKSQALLTHAHPLSVVIAWIQKEKKKTRQRCRVDMAEVFICLSVVL